MLFHDDEGSGWNSANVGWGPRYSWNEEKKLVQRIWYEPDSNLLVTHDYTYYRSGRLMAVGYEKMGSRSRDSVYAWMGAVVPYDQFRMKTHVLYSSAHPGDR